MNIILEKSDLIFMKETRLSRLRRKVIKDNIVYMRNPFGYLHCYNLQRNLILEPKTHKVIGKIAERNKLSQSSVNILNHINRGE